MKLSVVIPMYNEATTIEEVLDKVAAVELTGIKKEIIVADDGSTDGSLELVQRLASSPGRFDKSVYLSGKFR